MRLFGILFSCVCLQLASAPAAPLNCLAGKAVQRDPGQSSMPAEVRGKKKALEIAAYAPQADISSSRGPRQLAGLPPSVGPKEFFIRSGLSPPSIFG